MLRIGYRLGDRYRLADRIGAGGMGEVWRGVDEVLGRTVAVKAMLPAVADDPDFARRFLAEATAMARVNHPAVASIHDYGRSHDITYLVMEFVEGESLAQTLARSGRMTPEETMRVIAQAADGLQAIHDQGIVHRDIKPANLLIRRDGAVLITDFGIARHDDASRLTASGAILGTPSYLSPEQVLGQPATARSDVYSLGLTAYECLAGQKPFEGDNPYAVALQRLQAAPRTIGVHLPAPILGVVERALATDPAHRWPTAAALAEAARTATDPRNPWPGRAAHPGIHQPGGAAHATNDPHNRQPGQAAHATNDPHNRQPGDAAYAAFDPGNRPPGVATDPSAVPRSRPPARARKRTMLAALAALLVIGGVAGWGISRIGGDSNAATPGVTTTTTTATAAGGVLRECGTGFCPLEPLCWGGLTAISGKAHPPSRIDCTQEHAWETFVALAIPDGAADVRQDSLMGREEIANACSAAVMASRSKDPDATRSWRRDAWPITLPGGGTPLLHCLATPAEGGDTSGGAFLVG
ncbi:serine/threonine protein kinase [Actinoplanes sp. LDG1-06]|uniref:non-specific serine/threonine protein kinase n=1 Tax=Paractinoplanes ovalisporus TaxID=2810368 RepID=A0ABS2AM27_9ACTN|nr:serine/threonine-protein kinase [Actinoplanes ovalisporus]MBM2620895.1 serine/threonine protein kinase [Actinoplanes ovalisporus]